MKQVLIIGGTGIVGSAISEKCISNNFSVTAIGIEEKPVLKKGVEYVHRSDCSNITGRVWDAIIDVYHFDHGHEDWLCSNFKKCNHFIPISTTLVYDRQGYSFERITTNHPKAAFGTQGGYVDRKLAMERFWQTKDCVNFTILRPYHVIGPGSELGCLPLHNRDPYLLENIKKGKIILCDGGRIPLNIVHSLDLAEIVVRCIGNPATYGKAYNAVNPKEIIARNYYLKIAQILGVSLEIENVPGENVWQKGKWVLTTLPHLYDISDLSRDVNYVPSTNLETCLQDAIKNASKNQTVVYERMHTLPRVQQHSYFK